VRWITSTDAKIVGYLYLITSFLYFCFGGVLALIMRAQLAQPEQDLVGVDTDDALLICPKSRAQDVKNVVQQLERTGQSRYL